jgi:hypothetical protein
MDNEKAPSLGDKRGWMSKLPYIMVVIPVVWLLANYIY